MLDDNDSLFLRTMLDDNASRSLTMTLANNSSRSLMTMLNDNLPQGQQRHRRQQQWRGHRHQTTIN
jgi:hypothetical protein